jgi:RND family efflux transporter MFP subunit
MNAESRVSLRWTVVAASALALIALGAGATYVVLRTSVRSSAGAEERLRRSATRAADHDRPAASGPFEASVGALPDVVVALSPEAVERAAVRVVPVAAGTGPAAIRLPAVVEPNAYAQVVVTPLVAGRITRVLVGLGDHVRQGQAMAHIFSPDLAEAQTRYLSARAELVAHDRELQRTGKLEKIGAASRQELERVEAEHTARKTSLESARSRLELLGVSRAAIDGLSPGDSVAATTSVPAPIAGVVTERLANVGLNVDTASKLFTVVDLSTVWVVADVYEQDFSRVRIGSPAIVATTAYADLVLHGRISYIDPQLNPQTRTARARIEVPNARRQLRLGMYADVLLEGSGRDSAALIPQSAVQNVRDRHVVYLANPREPGKFIEREVRLGQAIGQQVEVLTGAKPGDFVVAEGSFFIRAERERLGLRPPMSASPGL